MKKLLVLSFVLFLSSIACDENAPTVPVSGPSIGDITLNNYLIVGTPLPNSTPAPGTPAPGSVDKTITGLTVTEIGGDGAKTFAVGETGIITATPRNAGGGDPCFGFPSLADCGAYTEQDIKWFAGTGVGGTGTSCDTASVIVLDLGPSETNYNRKFRTCRVGTFTYQAQFRSLEPVAFTGSVLATGATNTDLTLADFGHVTGSSYRAGGSGGGFGNEQERP